MWASTRRSVAMTERILAPPPNDSGGGHHLAGMARRVLSSMEKKTEHGRGQLCPADSAELEQRRLVRKRDEPGARSRRD
jgi:hypothetical protein